MLFQISVIITTSPGREDNLHHCLQALVDQQLPPAEVIVVDDGSAHGQAVTEAQPWPFPLYYLWRENDCRVARSRNLGAEAARSPLLVFIDSDILLNPRALEAYALFLDMKPNWLLYGYYGYQSDWLAPSRIVNGCQIQWYDSRYVDYTPPEIQPAPNMLRFPHEWAWSGNFALHRTLFFQIGGFDAHLRGWGGEDLDFASRALARGFEVHFLLDAWGEHQPHSVDEHFHKTARASGERQYISHYTPAAYPVRILSTPAGKQALLDTVHNFWLPQSTFLPGLGAR